MSVKQLVTLLAGDVIPPLMRAMLRLPTCALWAALTMIRKTFSMPKSGAYLRWILIRTAYTIIASLMYAVCRVGKIQYDKHRTRDKTMLQAVKSTFKDFLSPIDLLIANGTNEINKKLPVGINTISTKATGRGYSKKLFNNYIDRITSTLDCKTYSIQMSMEEQKQNKPGSRKFYWPADLGQSYERLELPQDTDLIILTDVDYYMDMNKQLVEHQLPHVIYTMSPSYASTSNFKQASYCFDGDGNYVVKHSNGKVFKHQLWDYTNNDMLVSEYGELSFTNLLWMLLNYNKKSTVHYTITQKRVDPIRVINYLTPKYTMTNYAYLAYYLRGELNSLRKFNPIIKVNDTNYVRFYTHKPAGLYVNTAKAGNYFSVQIPVDVDETIANAAKLSSMPILTGAVQSYIPKIQEGKEVEPILTKRQSILLTEYHRHNGPAPNFRVVDQANSITPYHCASLPKLEPEKPLLKAFMSPLDPNCITPLDNEETRIAGVKGRVIGFHKLLDNVQVKSKYYTYVDEFVRLTIPDNVAHQCSPIELDELLKRQSRANQRSILISGDLFEESEIHNVNQLFIKKEAYGKVTAPRGISPDHRAHKAKFACFIIGATHLLKKHKWYAFGKTPREIAERVAKVCEEALAAAINTDFGKWDGHYNTFFRYLELMLLFRSYATAYHDEILTLHQNQYNRRGYCGNMSWKGKSERGSGQPNTSDHNTSGNGFINYCTYREMKYAPEDAFDKLGIYGGDDGLSADVDPLVAAEVSRDLGHHLDIELIVKGQFGIKFLARIFGPDVWNGDPTSTCDLPRQLSKFHTTHNLPHTVSPMMKLQEKAQAYYLTDAETPIIGDFCSIVKHTVGFGTKAEKETREKLFSSHRNWAYEFAPSDQWPNQFDDWMISYALETYSTESVMYYAGKLKAIIDGGELDFDLLQPVAMREKVVPETASVAACIEDNGITTTLKTEEEEKQDAEQQEQEPLFKQHSDDKKKECKYYYIGRCKYGDKCKFHHAQDKLALLGGPTKICRNFILSKCDLIDCKRKHITFALHPMVFKPTSFREMVNMTIVEHNILSSFTYDQLASYASSEADCYNIHRQANISRHVQYQRPGGLVLHLLNNMICWLWGQRFKQHHTHVERANIFMNVKKQPIQSNTRKNSKYTKQPIGSAADKLCKEIRKESNRSKPFKNEQLPTKLRRTYGKNITDTNPFGNRGGRGQLYVNPQEDRFYGTGVRTNGTRDARSTINYTVNGRLAAVSRRVESVGMMRSMPITEGSVIVGEPARELQYMVGKERGLRTTGRELLAVINLGYASGVRAQALAGEHLAPAVPIDPSALGGRLAYFSDLFEQHRMLRARLHYVPVDPTTKQGAIAFVFTPDSGLGFADTGQASLVRAATSTTFLQTPIWQEASIQIHKSDAIKEYFDEETASIRFTTQGIISIIAASDIPADASGDTPIGVLYLDYDFEFYYEHLGNEISLVQTATFSIDSYTGTPSSPVDFIANLNAVADTNFCSLDWGVGTSVPVADAPDYMVVIQVMRGSMTPPWKEFPTEENQYISPGQVVFMRSYSTGTGTYRGVFFESYEAATDFSLYPLATSITAPLSPGQLYCNAGTLGSGTVVVNARFWKIQQG